MSDPAQVLRDYLSDNDLEFEERDRSFSFSLPGERKLQTPVRVDLGPHALAVHAFVCRNPDENHERVYRWLLERNLRTYAVAYAVDHLGDIYLDARLPLALVTPEEIDRVLGSVLSHADGSFNTILELGFASSIRKEWEWRNLRGESTRNLEAFRGWLESGRRPRSEAGALATPNLMGVAWPFFDLRIRSGEVLLRGVTDDDVPSLLAALPDDLEMNPANETFPTLGPDEDRRRQLVAELWKHRGTWSIDSWCLDLAVEVEGQVVGVQALEGERFLQLRTVDSFSWLAAGVRGRGLANLMRAGVLALAFEHLGAEHAVSSAVLDNAPSLAVSHRLGYVDNGVSRIVTPTGPATLQHVRLSRDDWRQNARTAEVSGLEACLPWFGIDQRPSGVPAGSGG